MGSLLEGLILLYPRKEMGWSNSMRVPLGWVVSALFMKIGNAVEKCPETEFFCVYPGVPNACMLCKCVVTCYCYTRPLHMSILKN